LKSEIRSKRLLAINFGGLGDEVLFLPTLRTIRTAHPSWHITLLTEPRAKSISDVTNVIDANIVFDIKKKPLVPADYWELVRLLRSGHYDVVLSSGSSPPVSMLLFLSGIPERVGFGSNAVAKLLLTNPVPLNRSQHAVRMYHDLVKGLGLPAECGAPEVHVEQTNVEKMSALLGTKSGAKTILLHPGTSRLAIEKGIIKNWDPQNWAELIRKFLGDGNFKVVLAGGPDDQDSIEQITTLLKSGSPSVDLSHPQFLLAYGKTTSLKDLVALIQLSDVIVCVDSAPMHLAVGLNKPTVAMFGPTDPAKLLWPDPRFTALRDPEAAARIGSADPFSQPLPPKPLTEPSPLQPLGQPYVQIPLDTVYQTAMDQLNRAANQGSSRE
jgi:lipopolysaccharide heptosyltransferase II